MTPLTYIFSSVIPFDEKSGLFAWWFRVFNPSPHLSGTTTKETIFFNFWRGCFIFFWSGRNWGHPLLLLQFVSFLLKYSDIKRLNIFFSIFASCLARFIDKDRSTFCLTARCFVLNSQVFSRNPVIQGCFLVNWVFVLFWEFDWEIYLYMLNFLRFERFIKVQDMYSWFHIKGSWSVHSFDGDYLYTHCSWGNLFHEIPGTYYDIIWN